MGLNARSDELLREILYFRLWEKIKTKPNQLRYLHRNNITALYFSIQCGMGNAISIFQYYSFICYHFVRSKCFSCTMWQNKSKLRANYVLQPCQRGNDYSSNCRRIGHCAQWNFRDNSYFYHCFCIILNFLTHQLPFKTVLTCNHTTSQPVALHAKQSDSELSEDSKPCCCESKVKWGPCQAWKVTLERGGTKQARKKRSAAVTHPSEPKKEDNVEWPCK